MHHKPDVTGVCGDTFVLWLPPSFGMNLKKLKLKWVKRWELKTRKKSSLFFVRWQRGI